MLTRAEGTTSTERLLARLGRRAFLSLWSYANVYRDQGGGKEVADLILVFDQHVVLFSDKEVRFQDGDVELAWQRWRASAITKSIDQLRGARRWLQQYPTRLFLDRACKEPFPLPLPDSARFHFVAVASGAAKRSQLTHGGLGSLLVTGDSRLGDRPFSVPARDGTDVIHVFNEATLPLILGELDTAPDLIDYLCEREAFVRRNGLGFATGEEDLLAVYLHNRISSGKGTFPNDGKTNVFEANIWECFERDGVLARHHDRIAPSYGWDELVDGFAELVFQERMLTISGSDGVAGHESRLRGLARTTRLERLVLVRASAELFQRSAKMPDSDLFRGIRSSERPDTVFAFVVMPMNDRSKEDYRALRARALHDYCVSIKAAHRDVRHVVGIASTVGTKLHSEDICYVGGPSWSVEAQEWAEEVWRESGLYAEPEWSVKGRREAAERLGPPSLRQRLRNERKRKRRAQRDR